MKLKIFFLFLLFTFVSTLLYSQPYEPPRPHHFERKSSFLVGLGSLFIVKPKKDTLFHFGTEGEYHFAGPLWFNYGGGFGVNGDVMQWDIPLGFVIKYRLPQSPLCPVFKANFVLLGFHPFEKGESNYVMGGLFGPGLRYVFQNERALGLHVDLQIGKQLIKPKETYAGIVLYLGFEF